MYRNSQMRSLSAVLICLPLFAIWTIWEGWQDLFLKGIALNYVWPSVMLLACVEYYVCYRTNSVKATTVGALIMAVSFILMVDWPVVMTDLDNIETSISTMSALAMALALLTFAFIWLKFNEFTIPRNMKWIPVVIAFASFVFPVFATAVVVEDGRSTLTDMYFFAAVWVMIYEMTRDLAGDKIDFYGDILSYLVGVQGFIIIVGCPEIAAREDGWELVVPFAVLSCLMLVDCVNGGHIEGAFFDGLKKLIRQPAMLLMFVAQLVIIACIFWCCLAPDFSPADALFAFKVVGCSAALTGIVAAIFLCMDYSAKKKAS